MRKFTLAMASLMVAGAAWATPEAGTYLIASGSANVIAQGQYLTIDDSNVLQHITPEAFSTAYVWTLAASETEGAVTLQNLGDSKYLFVDGGEATASETAIDLYMFENSYTPNAWGICLKNDANSTSFLNGYNWKTACTTWSNDIGSSWLFTKLEGITAESTAEDIQAAIDAAAVPAAREAAVAQLTNLSKQGFGMDEFMLNWYLQDVNAATTMEALETAIAEAEANIIYSFKSDFTTGAFVKNVGGNQNGTKVFWSYVEGKDNPQGVAEQTLPAMWIAESFEDADAGIGFDEGEGETDGTETDGTETEKPTVTDSKIAIYIKNLSTGKYLAPITADNTNINLVDSKDDAGIYMPVAANGWVVFRNAVEGSVETYLNLNPNFGLLTWNDTSDANAFFGLAECNTKDESLNVAFPGGEVNDWGTTVCTEVNQVQILVPTNATLSGLAATAELAVIDSNTWDEILLEEWNLADQTIDTETTVTVTTQEWKQDEDGNWNPVDITTECHPITLITKRAYTDPGQYMFTVRDNGFIVTEEDGTQLLLGGASSMALIEGSKEPFALTTTPDNLEEVASAPVASIVIGSTDQPYLGINRNNTEVITLAKRGDVDYLYTWNGDAVSAGQSQGEWTDPITYSLTGTDGADVITENGVYTLSIPAGFFLSEDGNTESAETVVTFTVGSEAPVAEGFALDVTPAEGELTENLMQIVIKGATERLMGVELNSEMGIALYKDAGDEPMMYWTISQISDSQQWHGEMFSPEEYADYTLKAEGDAAIISEAGTYMLIIPAGVFTNEDGTAYNEDTIVTWTATMSGIENITVNGQKVIYDLGGRRVNNASKGIYIINGQKVLVK